MNLQPSPEILYISSYDPEVNGLLGLTNSKRSIFLLGIHMMLKLIKTHLEKILYQISEMYDLINFALTFHCKYYRHESIYHRLWL